MVARPGALDVAVAVSIAARISLPVTFADVVT